MFRTDYLTPAVLGLVGIGLISLAVAGVIELRTLAVSSANAPRPADFPITHFLMQWIPAPAVVSPAKMAANIQIVFAVIVLTGVALCFGAVFQTIHRTRNAPIER